MATVIAWACGRTRFVPARLAKSKPKRSRRWEGKGRRIVGPEAVRLAVRAEEERCPAPNPERPQDRNECREGDRPCPFASCRYHIAVDVARGGSLSELIVPLEELAETCALDVADRGDHTLEAVADLLGLTRERVRQIEARALRRLSRRGYRLQQWRPEER